MFIEQNFERLTAFTKGDYENCQFSHCQFSEQHLSRSTFISCIFDQCNLNLIHIQDTKFQDCTFRGCPMMGLAFEKAYRIGMEVRFENCQLDHSSFVGLTLPQTKWVDCRLTGVDFSKADLRESDFSGSTLAQAQFFNTRLDKADFRTAFDFQLNPRNNSLKKTKIALSGLPGLLTEIGLQIYPG